MSPMRWSTCGSEALSGWWSSSTPSSSRTLWLLCDACTWSLSCPTSYDEALGVAVAEHVASRPQHRLGAPTKVALDALGLTEERVRTDFAEFCRDVRE